MFNNRILLILLAASFMLLLYDYFYPIESEYNIRRINSYVFEYAGIAILLVNGGFGTSRYARWINLSLGIIVVGVLIKIMRWPGANELLTLGFSSIFLICFLYFITKKKYSSFTSIMKLVVLTSFLATPYMGMMHLPGYREMIVLNELIFVVVLVVFIALRFDTLVKT